MASYNGNAGNTGYYSGMLEGMKGIVDIQHTRLQDAVTRDVEVPAKQFALMQAKEEYKTEQAKQNLLKQAFAAADAADGAADNDEFQAGVWFKASRALAGIDPDAAIKMADMGEKFRNKAVDRKEKAVDLRLKNMQVVGEIADSLASQEDLDRELPNIEAAGIKVPEKFRVWNEDTKKWWKQKAMLSTRVVAANQVAVAQAKVENDTRRQELNEQKAETARLENEAKEERLRNRVAPMSEPTQAQRFAAEDVLKANEDFDELSDEQKAVAVDDYLSYAYSLQGGANGLPAAAAKQQARDKVWAGIKKEKGRFGIFSDYKYDSLEKKDVEGVPAKTSPKPDFSPKKKLDPSKMSRSQIIAALMDSNKGMSFAAAEAMAIDKGYIK